MFESETFCSISANCDVKEEDKNSSFLHLVSVSSIVNLMFTVQKQSESGPKANQFRFYPFDKMIDSIGNGCFLKMAQDFSLKTAQNDSKLVQNTSKEFKRAQNS